MTDELAGQFQGRVIPPTMPEDKRTATKLKELETNLNMVQLKLFLDNSDTILTQARSLNTPLYDCLVEFDLRESPPTTDVVKYTDVYEKPEHIKKFEETRLKENITCNYCTNFYRGELDEEEQVPRLIMRRLFPLEWLMKQNK